MRTNIYMVRHGESPKTDGNERARGLTDQGWRDAGRITELLAHERIDTYISSPYRRAILTIEEAALRSNKEIMIYEDLRELSFTGEDRRLPDHELYPAVYKLFANPNDSLAGGESVMACQARSVAVLKDILRNHRGENAVIGTHGAVMTLMMGAFDSRYDVHFLMNTSKPDVYKLEFDGERLEKTTRLWNR